MRMEESQKQPSSILPMVVPKFGLNSIKKSYSASMRKLVSTAATTLALLRISIYIIKDVTLVKGRRARQMNSSPLSLKIFSMYI